jgi:hypothetical protein
MKKRLAASLLATTPSSQPRGVCNRAESRSSGPIPSCPWTELTFSAIFRIHVHLKVHLKIALSKIAFGASV